VTSCEKKITIGVLGCCLLVLLRVAIGWQFLYEGLWKLHTKYTPEVWTAKGYLANAQGPLRPFFRSLTGDPDDLSWLDPEIVMARWDRWAQAFADYYQLDKAQRQRLDQMLNGSKAFYAALDELPKGVKFEGSLAKVIRYDAKNKRLVVDGKLHLTPRERDRLLAMVTIKPNPTTEEEKRQNEIARKFQKAVRDVYARSSRPANHRQTGMSFKERLLAMLKGDPEKAGIVRPDQKGTIDYKQLGDIDLYRHQVARYEKKLAEAKEAFQFEHAKKLRSGVPKSVQELKSNVVAPVKALDAEFKEEAYKLLTAEQFARGPVTVMQWPMDYIDATTMWSLTVIGVLLIAGLLTRLSALAAAGWLVMFYLAMPPWPGVPPAPGPEHALFINKNLIEAIAMLAIAALPTGQWFGLDAVVGPLLRRYCCCCRRKREESVEQGASKAAGPTGESAEKGESTGEAEQGKSM